MCWSRNGSKNRARLSTCANKFCRIICFAVSFCSFFRIGDANSGRCSDDFGVFAIGEISGGTCVSCCILLFNGVMVFAIGVFASGEIYGGMRVSSCTLLGVIC